MDIQPLQPNQMNDAAGFFARNYRRQRQAVPVLPETMESVRLVAGKLGQLSGALAAMQDGQLLGYLGWFMVDDFRDTDRRGAYCPEWAHGCVETMAPAVYRALYHAAAELWTEQGCKTHALSILANDHAAEKVWFWNGFGLAVVDAIRPMLPLQVQSPEAFSLRKAQVEDAATVAALDAEHWRHYTTPPIFMRPRTLDDAEAYREFLAQPENAVWLAATGGEPAGLMRFEGKSYGAAAIVESQTTAALTAAYVRPALRGRGVAAALLDAALRDYAALGFKRCAVDFESFNPDAAAFWPRFFEPVCYSLIRHPEALL